MNTFEALGLPKSILAKLSNKQFLTPTPIQAEAIPHALAGKDILGSAQTGTGKTAAFSLPIVNQIEGKDLQAIIICPTRELCLQISEDIKKFTKHAKKISTTAVYGGENIMGQIRALKTH